MLLCFRIREGSKVMRILHSKGCRCYSAKKAGPAIDPGFCDGYILVKYVSVALNAVYLKRIDFFSPPSVLVGTILVLLKRWGKG